MKSWLVLGVLLLVSPAWAVCGGTSPNLVAAAMSQAAIAECLAVAVDNDIINVPAGSGAWTTAPVNLTTVSVSIIGAGIDQSIITDNRGVGNTSIFGIQTAAGKTYRVSGFTINGGTGSCTQCGAIWASGDAPTSKWRADHIKFNNLGRPALRTEGHNFGVFDSNIVIENVSPGPFGMLLEAATWGSGLFGDGSWAEASTLGQTGADANGPKAIYIEDNTFSSATPGSNAGILDTYNGARWVIRYNSMTDNNMSSHGTESSGRQRGLRQFEVYGNTMTNNVAIQAFFVRSGIGMIWGNSVTGHSSLATLENYRSFATFSWGSCDGISGWDVVLNGVFFSGTHTGANGATVLTDSGQSFGGTDTLKEYTIHNLTTARSTIITNNTGTTITPSTLVFISPLITFNTGDSYEVRHAYPCLDQPGWVGGTQLSGNPASPEVWPGQTREGVYAWSNTGVTNIGLTTPNIQLNRELYNPPTGARTSRPSTCTTGEAYWSTDQGGNWMQGTTAHPDTTGANDGTLDKCTATNTWTDNFYTPYTYPHPLRVPR